MINLYAILAAIGAILAAIGAAWASGRRSKARDQKLDAMKKEAQAHGRINEADLGIGAADGANAKWMREYADRHGKR